MPGPAPPTLAVAVPKDDFSLPANLYVLPVLLVPSDLRHLAESPAAPGQDLAGKPMNAARLNEFRIGRQNLSVHLHMARRKYEAMLRNPLNGTSRGTFRLAAWDPVANRAGAITATNQLVAPVIVSSPIGVDTIAALYARKNYSFLGPVLDAVGCRQSTCPFVFVIAVMGDPISRAGGQRFNHGYNNGGGWLVLNFLADVVKAADAGSEGTLQSTLLHEIGHAFGLPHVSDYCAMAGWVTCLARLTLEGSPSVMSYNKKNQIYGCGFANKDQSNPPPWQGACTYPGHAAVDAFPGAFVAEDLRVLGMNRRAFPGLFYEPALDAPNTTVSALNGTGKTSITGHESIELRSLDTSPDATNEPSMLLGGDDNAMPDFFDAFDAERMWRSRNVGPGGWASLTVSLPAKARLTRIDVYSGYASGTHVSTGIRVRVGSTVAAQVLTSTANQTIIFGQTAKDFIVDLRAGGSGQVVLRGIRMWGEVAGKTVELYPAAEPRVIEATADTYAGSLANIVGSAQGVRAYAEPFHATLGWHSSKAGAGAWISLTVEFPHAVRLGSVKVHTGHFGTYHAARQVQVERRCVCGSTDPGGCAASTVACARAGAGAALVEWVTRIDASPDQLVAFDGTTARVWKVAMRSPSAAEQTVDAGYVHVRGLRFFRPDGKEIFPARVVAPGI